MLGTYALATDVGLVDQAKPVCLRSTRFATSHLAWFMLRSRVLLPTDLKGWICTVDVRPAPPSPGAHQQRGAALPAEADRGGEDAQQQARVCVASVDTWTSMTRHVGTRLMMCGAAVSASRSTSRR